MRVAADGSARPPPYRAGTRSGSVAPMSHPERARRHAEDPAEQRAPGAQRQSATPAQAILALQASAGNQAVTAQLHRYYTKPGATRASGQPTNLKKEPMEGWVENGEDPVGEYLVQEGEHW